MVTGVGKCSDAIDANGLPLPPSEADPLTIKFLGAILDLEKPDLVILAGDQLHHDIQDSQTALFKVVAPLIERRIPYATVFGNHDSEGEYAMSREDQMTLLRSLPFNLSQSGPEEVNGVGNFYLRILSDEQGVAFGGAKEPLACLFFVDSHGQIPSKSQNPDYDAIKQTQIDWFLRTSQSLRRIDPGQTLRKFDRGKSDESFGSTPISLVFMHIPLPEYADASLFTFGGSRREPTEGPSLNSHFYDALVHERVAAVGCGHDHVNDFCGLLQRPTGTQLGPWLCYGGGSGFGGYCSYGEHRYYRRTRVWKLDTKTGGIKTWKRLEYHPERVDELVLMEAGAIVAPQGLIDAYSDSNPCQC
ncbi:hypothetical protein N0V82_004383 [Gnomoniopsis sp. IMI 355080]|nr:hypothetical protein N0V82_004383 [Gnomoniopsis sp. IMI 355080]